MSKLWKYIAGIALSLLLTVPALAYDHKITVLNSDVVSEAQVRHIVEVTEILCDKELDGPLQVVFLPRMFMETEDGIYEICGATDCQKPYAILISESRYPIFQWGLLAHEIAHNLRPEWTEEQILSIEYQFRACYGRI